MAEYLIYFNQQWVGEHTPEWFISRGPLAKAVVDEMKEAGVYVFAGGLEEGAPVNSADATSGSVLVTDVADDETATMWAGRLAEGCGWPQEVRRFGVMPQAE